VDGPAPLISVRHALILPWRMKPNPTPYLALMFVAEEYRDCLIWDIKRLHDPVRNYPSVAVGYERNFVAGQVMLVLPSSNSRWRITASAITQLLLAIAFLLTGPGGYSLARRLPVWLHKL
jgi:hypothetical protein